MIHVGYGIWQRSQWRGLVDTRWRPVGVVEILVLPQHRHQVALVPDQGPVQQLTLGSTPTPLFDHDRIHPGAWTAERMTRVPAAWNTASNACVKLASRSCRTSFRRVPASSRSTEQVTGLLDDPGLDRVLRGAQDPGASAAVLDQRKDVHLRPIEQVSGEEVQRQDPLVPEIAGTPPTRGRSGGAPGRSRRP